MPESVRDRFDLAILDILQRDNTIAHRIIGIVTVASMSGYDALTRRLFFGNRNAGRFRPPVVMDRIKTGLAVQLPNPSPGPI